MHLLVVSPGASWSTADVDAGVRAGLEAHGVEVSRYLLTERIERSKRWMYTEWRRARRADPGFLRPTIADIFYHAGVPLLERALRLEPDAVLVVSAMFLHPDLVILLRRAHRRVYVLFTETPYDLAQELKVAALVDGCWTHEASAVDAFRAVTRAGYLPHAWHPARHSPIAQASDAAFTAHDVVFVGSGFPERLAWLSAIDWTGIDLGLYGHWDLKPGHPLAPFVCGGTTSNADTTALYRRAKLGINLYRDAPGAVSLNPRAYELAACGVPHLSTPRAEVSAKFGDLVPQVSTPAEAEAAIRGLLADDARRAAVRDALPGLVRGDSWADRITTLLGDLQMRRAA